MNTRTHQRMVRSMDTTFFRMLLNVFCAVECSVSDFIAQFDPLSRLLLQETDQKWCGSVTGVVNAPLDDVWSVVSQTKRLPEWMPMFERCMELSGKDGVPGYVRLVSSGFMFPQKDGERFWIKERLVSMDHSTHSYTYKMEASNVGLDGSQNTLRLVDYGEGTTLVNWSFLVDPVEDVGEDSLMDYLGFLYKSFINRVEAASSKTNSIS